MTPRHTLLALLVVVLWGFNFVIIDEGLDGVPPLLFLALRFVIVAIPAIFLVPRPKAPWHIVVLIGLFLSLGQFSLLYLSLAAGMPPGLASLLLQVQVVFTLILASVTLREKPRRMQIVGTIVGMIGLGIVISGQAAIVPLLALLLIFAAALSWATGNVITRHAKISSGLSLVVWSALVVPIPSFALSLLVDGPTVVGDALAHLSLAAILSTVYTAVAASLVGYGIWNSLMARYPAARVAPFTLLVPVIGIAAAWVVQHEQPSVTDIIGGAVMLAGLAAAVIVFDGRRRGPAAADGLAAPLDLPAPTAHEVGATTAR
ncbi:EamA family transporter [Labedella endophytica]|uniref:EamA family transporter n=1 Tax=Labedella endophytica TaxID=1523160 RepID=A0A3S0VG02_9MICO|nr:EamA family transporter [Labedella endophytica]RUR00795.1 EamA family transporter [Labedella endophytica]